VGTENFWTAKIHKDVRLTMCVIDGNEIQLVSNASIGNYRYIDVLVFMNKTIDSSKHLSPKISLQ